MKRPGLVIADLLAGRLEVRDVPPADIPVLVLALAERELWLAALRAKLETHQAMVEPAHVEPEAKDDGPMLLTVTQAARMAQVASKRVYELVREDWSPFTRRIGRSVRVERAGLEAWMRSGR